MATLRSDGWAGYATTATDRAAMLETVAIRYGARPLMVTADAQGGSVADPAELAAVDGQIPAGGRPIPLKAGRHGLVGQEAGSDVPPGLGIGNEGPTATDVVDMTVGVNEAVDRSVRPSAECSDHRRTGPHAAGVPAHQPLVGVDHPAVRERFQTDNGNIIVDARNLDLTDPLRIEQELNCVAGIVENGIFAKESADAILVGSDEGVRHILL